jgi:hypothetical protein
MSRNYMAIKSILKKSNSKSYPKKKLRFSEKNYIKIIPNKEDIKKEEKECNKMEDVRALLHKNNTEMKKAKLKKIRKRTKKNYIPN